MDNVDIRFANRKAAEQEAIHHMQKACVAIATAKSLAGQGERGRQLALAQTKVEEALLWAGGAFPALAGPP